ncbi:uncharacterized protein LOC118433121 [Folsomia candida]|uniref:Leucine-rich repeat-containing protein 56 n=1 Tax=Folsomia candida TaxID=158441 RepID=A0A226D1K9_FOLCA|nr:uncharacterized protein LOC118433121 [Folsomia candida]OXA38950.1 Leucine-rich repeat-containing protein 56 [Folsomia candida]
MMEEMMGDMLLQKQTDGEEDEDAIQPPPTPGESKTLEAIHMKKYEEGDVGKLEAIRDLQSVFDELHQQKVISQPVDLLAPPPREKDGPALTGRKRFPTSALTPLIPLNLKNKEFASEQNLARGQRLKDHQAISLPLLLKVEREKLKLKKKPPTVTTDSEALSVVLDDLAVCSGQEVAISCEDDSETDAINLGSSQGEEQTDQEGEDATWKDDVIKMNRLRSKSSINISAYTGGETLILQHKPPIWPHQQDLHRILARMPTLTCLILDGSDLECFRDLGSSVPSLCSLSVVRCGLKTLDGTAALPNLRTLIASNNNLKNAVQCSFLAELCHLDLSSNPIKDIGPFAHLKACTKLRSLKLYATPVSRSPDFYSHIKYLLPRLKEVFPFSDSYSPYFRPKFIPKGVVEGDVDEDDLARKVMRQEFQIIYQNNFEKPKGYERVVAPKPGERENEGDPGVTTDDGGMVTETDDNFEQALLKSIRMVQIENVSTDSFLTTEASEADEMGGAGGDHLPHADLFYSAGENSDGSEQYEDANSDMADNST